VEPCPAARQHCDDSLLSLIEALEANRALASLSLFFGLFFLLLLTLFLLFFLLLLFLLLLLEMSPTHLGSRQARRVVPTRARLLSQKAVEVAIDKQRIPLLSPFCFLRKEQQTQ